jgi:hypothetical protein
MTAFEFMDELPMKRSNKSPDPLIVEFAKALKAHLKQWAKFPKALSKSSAQSYASAINHAIPPAPVALRDGSFEATCRAGVLYVRAIA